MACNPRRPVDPPSACRHGSHKAVPLSAAGGQTPGELWSSGGVAALAAHYQAQGLSGRWVGGCGSKPHSMTLHLPGVCRAGDTSTATSFAGTPDWELGSPRLQTALCMPVQPSMFSAHPHPLRAVCCGCPWAAGLPAALLPPGPLPAGCCTPAAAAAAAGTGQRGYRGRSSTNQCSQPYAGGCGAG